MKIKKLSAIFSAVALLASVICINTTAANLTPTVTVFGNESVPSNSGETFTFTVRLSDFADVEGADLIILGDDGLTFDTVTSTDMDLKENENYTKAANKIHIVDLTDFTNGYANIVVTATATKSANITVSGELALSDTELVSNAQYVPGKAVVAPAYKAVETPAEIKDSDKTFIPYGSVYKEEGVFLKKDANGSYGTLEAGTNYKQFTVPENGILTFGKSETEYKSAKAFQFGSYAKKDGNNYGTMCIAGNWSDFVKYFTEVKGKTVQELITLISTNYDKHINGSRYVTLSCNDGAYKIRVYKFMQTKVMWESESAKEYALRIYNVKAEEYVGVAFYTNGEETRFSSLIETVNNNG